VNFKCILQTFKRICPIKQDEPYYPQNEVRRSEVIVFPYKEIVKLVTTIVQLIKAIISISKAFRMKSNIENQAFMSR